MSEWTDVFVNGGTMRTLAVFHCLLTFRQFLPLVLSVLGIVLLRSRETLAATGVGRGTGSANGADTTNNNNIFATSSSSSAVSVSVPNTSSGSGSSSSSSSSSSSLGRGSYSVGPSSSSSVFTYGGSSDLYNYGGSNNNDNNTEKPPRNPIVYQIGGVLSNNKSIASFNETIQYLNFNPKYIKEGTTLIAHPILMDPNPIRTAINVCDFLIKKQIYAVIVSHSALGELSSAAVSYTSGFYHIPVIGISSRDSAFSDKNIHVSFLRTVPPYSHQADVWVEILKHFHYEKVIFLHSSDTDGRSVLGRFQTNAQNLEDDIEIKIELVVELEPGGDNYTRKLSELTNAQARVYLLYASMNDAKAIFSAAAANNLTKAGHVWIVTEQLLRSRDIPQGALGIKLLKADNETAHINDCLRVFAAALREMGNGEQIMEAPNDCNSTATTWETGRKLFEYIKKQELVDGETGKVVFDESGDRINAEYHVINIHRGRQEYVVGQYLFSKEKKEMILTINDTAISWPGNLKVKPAGFMIPTHLRVLTIEEVPFVFVRRVGNESECALDEVKCPHYNTTTPDAVGPIVMNCCRGYCIDLLRQLKDRMNFTFDLSLSPDGQFGSCITKNGTGKKEWTGLIGQLVNERAEMIVAPLTITPERAQVIEFSKPFKYQGITILVKTERKDPKFGSFLQPFRGSLWILVMVSVHIVALALYLLDRFSPFGRYRLANMDGTEEDALNLSSAIWFAWGVLLNSGIGEGTPRSFAARVLGIVWAGFAMIIVASYTANLAAFLVLDRPKTQFSGIHDNRLRNPATSFNYSTVKGSAVEMYFRRQVELSNMYRVMERMNYDTAQAAIDAVKKQTLGAFIWDSSRLQYEAAQDCDLMTSGELFGRSGYAIGLQKGSPWANEVTLAILEFHESGFMEKLDERWIINPQRDPTQPPKTCKIDQKVPTTLGLENMHDAFYLIAGGIVGGLVLILIEVFYKKHQLKRQRQLEIARHAADKWRHTVQQRKLERSLEAQRRFKENGPPPFWTPGLECRQRSPIAGKSNTIFV